MQHADILPWAVWVALGDTELCFVTGCNRQDQGVGYCGFMTLLAVQGPVPRALVGSSSSRDCLPFGFQVTASSKALKYSWDVLSALQVENPWLKCGPHSRHQALSASPAAPRYPCSIGSLQRSVILLVK